MTKRNQGGFTLIELIIFIVIVGAGLAGILSASTTAVKSTADPLVRKQTIAIAESLLEEILLKDYENPSGGYTGSNRTMFDDVGDYAGYSWPTVVDALGQSAGLPTSYKIEPAISVTTETINSEDLKKVVVSVTGPQGVISLTGYRGKDR